MGQLWVSTCRAGFDSGLVVLELWRLPGRLERGCWSASRDALLSQGRGFLSLWMKRCHGVIWTDVGPGCFCDGFGSHSFLLDLDSPGPGSSLKPFLQLDKTIARFPQDGLGSSSV